ncbi:hypothetical protein EV2_009120 [Malus domestica]
MPDAFTDLAKVTISHILAANAPTRIDVLNLRPERPNHPRRPPDSKHSQPRKWKTAQTTEPSLNPTTTYLYIPTYEVILDYGNVLDETNWPPENLEISVHYAVLDEVWNQNKMIVDDALAYTVVTDIMLSDDIEPRSVDECQHRTDWLN